MKSRCKRFFYVFFWLIITSQFAYSQLEKFTLELTNTDETCNGNGTISMIITGETPGSTIVYRLFLLPDTETAIAQTTNDNFNNLDSGDYLVVATQTLDNNQNSQEANATIEDLTTNLDYEISQTVGSNCNFANIVVNGISGNPISYEIISGPETRPEQSSNVFNDLGEGTYIIRVFDECNNAVTKTYTLNISNSDFSATPIELPVIFTSCDMVTISNLVTASDNSNLFYPITVNYTIFPPGGGTELEFSDTFENGNSTELDISRDIDLFGNEIFDAEIEIIDFCGETLNLSGAIDPNPNLIINSSSAECGRKLITNLSQFVPPYVLEFIESPEGFIDTGANAEPDGTYVEPIVTFGEDETGVPFGEYTIFIEDACGRTTTESTLLEEVLDDPIVAATNSGCDSTLGTLLVNIPDREIVSASFSTVPSNYDETPPVDLSQFITDDGTIEIENILPIGDYTLELIDNCGSSYTVNFAIPDFVVLEPSIVTTPNCADETGTLRISSPYGELTQVIVTNAPSSFSESLPFDISSQITSLGIFFVGNLPVGSYELEAQDECGNSFNLVEFVQTYQSDDSIYNLERNCGSFNLGILDSDTSVFDQTYWFQKYNPDTDSWEHPNTGVTYPEGTLPNTNNSVQILNEETLFNIFLTGRFRLIKAFQPFNNPNPGENCLDIFAEFDIFSELTIVDVFNINCEGGSGTSDVFVEVNGVAPFNFSIVSPSNVNNGNNNIFNDLAPGIYEFRVEDVCGSIENITINTEDLAPLVSVNQPDDLGTCDGNSSGQATFDLSQQSATIIGSQNPEIVTVTYHLNQDDADSGANPISESYENVANPQRIYARVVNNTSDICFQTTSFELIVGSFPILTPDEAFTICDGGTLTLTADSGFSSYLWSTNETTQSIVVEDSGNYSVAVSSNFGNISCESIKNFTVVESSIATIESISVNDFNGSDNSLSIEVTGSGDYEYSLDGIFYQDDANFLNLQSGEYTIYVRDKNGCGEITETVFVMNYMKFFTPNNDSINDYWQVIGAATEPDLEVFIFDRYGKILNNFRGNERGWDGTYNGRIMPTNDYWFMIKRDNGRTYKGHFTLKR